MSRKARIALWVGAALVAFVHLWRADGGRGPGIFADEVGYLANARYLAGAGSIDMFQTAFYSSGWSLVIVPLTWLMPDDPGRLYESVVLVQAVLAALSIVMIAHFCRWLFATSARVVIPAALAAGLYPAFVTNSGFVWSESMTTFLLVATVSAFAWLARGAADDEITRNALWFRSVVAGAAAGYLVFVHRRTLLALVAAVAIMVAYLIWKRAFVPLALVIATGGVVTLAGQLLNGRLNDVLWHGEGGVDASGKLSSLRHLEGLKDTALAGSGQSWYQLVATGGLVAVAIVGLVVLVLDRTGRLERRTLAAVVVMMTGAILFVSALFLSKGTRADHLIYGRYLDVATPLLVACAITWLGARPSVRALLTAASVTVAALFSTYAVLEIRGGGRLSQPFNPVNTFAILGWFNFRHWTPGLVRATIWSAAIALAAITIALVLRRFSTRAWMASTAIAIMIAGLFFWQLGFERKVVLNSMAKGSHRSQELIHALDATGVEQIALDNTIPRQTSLALAYWLPDIRFVTATPETARCANILGISRTPPAPTPGVTVEKRDLTYLSRRVGDLLTNYLVISAIDNSRLCHW